MQSLDIGLSDTCKKTSFPFSIGNRYAELRARLILRYICQLFTMSCVCLSFLHLHGKNIQFVTIVLFPQDIQIYELYNSNRLRSYGK